MAKTKRNRRHKRNTGMPSHGALFVTNGKRRRKAHKAKAKRRSTVGAVRRAFALNRKRTAKRNRATKRNSLAVMTNGKRARKTNRRHKRNSLAVMTNRRSTKRNRRSYKRNSLAVVTNGKRGLRRRVKRNTGLVHRVSGTARGLLAKIPLVGTLLATYAGPALFGALVVEPIRMVLKYGGKYLPAPVQKFGFTLGGLVIAVIVGLIPGLSRETKKSLAMASATAGGAIDFYRWRTGQSGYGDIGDGGAYETVPYSDAEVGAVMLDYTDASYADAAYADADLGEHEGNAALAGPRVWRTQFFPGGRGQGIRNTNGPSRHAGKPGGQWGWLIKLVGWPGFIQITQLPPEQRIAVIADLKKQARGALPGLISQNSPAEINIPAEHAGYADAYGDLYAMQS